MNDGAPDGSSVGLRDGCGNDGATLSGFLLVFLCVGDNVISIEGERVAASKCRKCSAISLAKLVLAKEATIVKMIPEVREGMILILLR